MPAARPSHRYYICFVPLVMCFGAAALQAGEDQAMNRLVRPYSPQTIVCLNEGESYRFRTHAGNTRTVRLVSVQERRDSVVQLIREATVRLTIDGRSLELLCMPYTMPTKIGDLRLQADLTSVWTNGLPGRVQLSIWNADDPIVNTNTFQFPIRNYRLFSHAMQAYNEVVHAGERDGDPQGQRFYHGYGFDLAGYEGREIITACTDGRIVQLWPTAEDARSVVIEGAGGVVWEAAHMDSTAPGLQLGQTVRMGQTIGVLGKRGPSGNFSHLHFAVFPSRAHLDNHTRTERLNLYPWIVAAYRKQHPDMFQAVAGPHHTVRAGETVRLNGSSIHPESVAVSYRWEFDDGESVDNAQAERQYNEPGVYIATLHAQDRTGNESVDFSKIKVFSRQRTEGSLPSIFMTHTPTSGLTAPRTVTIRCWLQGGTSDGMFLDFGDGHYRSVYSSYDAVEHRFTRPGNHIVTARTTVDGMPIMQRQCVRVDQ